MPKLTRLQRALWALAGLGVAGWLIGIAVEDDGAHRTLGAGAITADFALIDHTGAATTDEDLRGNWLVVFFGFTNCPDICPTTLAEIAAARAMLGDAAAALRPVLITVDPERDTPEALAAYVAAFDADAIGLTGEPAAVAAAARGFKAYFRRAADPGDPDGYTVDHSTFLYLIGPDGAYVDFFRFGLGADALAAALKSRMGAS
jgi:protein SCO1/2